MDCRILRSLTLKSDGHLSCDDSTGYAVHLGEVSTKPAWSIKKVFDAPVWAHVRRSFNEGRVPWPGTCEVCELLSPGGAPRDTLATSVEVRIEPTLACELRCPCCGRMAEVRRRQGDWHLDPALFESLLKSFVSLGIDVPCIIYLGLGEPLDHPAFHSLVKLASEIVPSAIQEVTTNGNPSYRDSIADSCLDRIIVSCDGVRQSSYVKYRIRGEVARALQFMRDVRQYAKNRPFLEWKYILFEFNDSDEELLEAQKTAEEIGVDSIMFIVTNSRFHSKRFMADRLYSFPWASPIATISPAAAMQKVLRPGKVTLGGPASRLYVDHCDLWTCGVVRLEGWGIGADGSCPDRVEVMLGDKVVGSVRPLERRPDVQKVHPDAAGPLCGFILQFPFPAGAASDSKGEVSLDLRIRLRFRESSLMVDGVARFPTFDPAVFAANYYLPAEPLVTIQPQRPVNGHATSFPVLASPATCGL